MRIPSVVDMAALALWVGLRWGYVRKWQQNGGAMVQRRTHRWSLFVAV